MKKETKEFWDNIILNKDWTPNMEQIYKELTDFSVIMEEVPEIYMAVSWWRISKPLTHANAVIWEFEEQFIEKDIARDDMLAMIDSYKIDEIKPITKIELKREIKQYF